MPVIEIHLSRVVLVTSLLLISTSQTSAARAAEPSVPPSSEARSKLERKPIDATAALLVGYGSNEFNRATGAPNPFNVGFGLAFGLTFLDVAYLGTNVVYYVGQSGPNAINTETGQVGAFRMSTLTATLDAGVRLRIAGEVTLRPYLGVGLLERFAAIPGASANVHRLYVAPSLALQVPLRDQAFIGADVRYGLAVASADTQSNVAGFAAVGYRF